MGVAWTPAWGAVAKGTSMRDSRFLPLTAEEIVAAAAIARAASPNPESLRFAAMYTHEPDKWQLREGAPVSRQARALLVDRSDGSSWDMVVDLDAKSVLQSDKVLVGASPVLMEEFMTIGEKIKEDPRYREALAKRGIQDLSLVQIDPWAISNVPDVDISQGRLCSSVSYVRHFEDDNGYAHPIEGVVAIADLTTGRVLEIFDYGVKPMNEECANYLPEFNQPLRDDIAPLSITQPNGPGFSVNGHEITWQRWRLNAFLTPIEGLVIQGVELRDAGEWRTVMHRASLSEMVVPYGETDPNHLWRCAFDAGEFGLGKLANSLTLGCDCLGEIVYMDAVLASETGEPQTIRNAICIHEEDDGILWKHTDWVTDKVEVRRSRRLVVSSISTVGNYEYGFFWYFYLDGTIQFEAKLTGVMQTKAVEAGAPDEPGTWIGPNLVATIHQHHFSFRLDMEVDGWRNRVYQSDVYAPPVGPGNEHGNAIRVNKTLAQTENSIDGMVSPQSARTWVVVSSDHRNAWGTPTGYKLLPGWANSTLFAQSPSHVAARAGFAKRNVWVTPFDQGQMRAAGDFPNQNRTEMGLPAWVREDRSVVDTDVVLWYNLGVTHIPRVEDWPVMPVERAGFMLVPVNFFDRNPTMDVPPSEPAACHQPGSQGEAENCQH